MQSINPANDELLREYAETEPAAVERILAEAERAFESWRSTSFAARAERMRRAGSLLRERKEELARLMALEMGKPLAQGRAEAEKCALGLRLLRRARPSGSWRREQSPTDATRSFVAFQPLGVVLAVMPWNFPFWQVFRFAAPALMAGNAGLLKHASNVPGCALAIEEIFRDAGFPKGLFRTLLIGSGARGRVDRGAARSRPSPSPAARRRAARWRRRPASVLKKTVLELGGSDPYLVLEDADLEPAAETCVASRLINGGQSCIAAKRFIVVEPVRDALRGAVRRADAGQAHGRSAGRRRRRWARWRAATCATSCTSRSQTQRRARRARCCWAARSPTGRAPTTRRPCWPTSARACRPTTRSCSGRWRR